MRSFSNYYYKGCEEVQNQTHFLDSCFLCHKPLSHKSDIFMYRGNTPFCSQECRQEQIESDASNEKRLKLSSAKRSSNTVKVKQIKESTKEYDTKESVRTGIVAVA